MVFMSATWSQSEYDLNMEVLDINASTVTISFDSSEAKLLAVMTQFWCEELPSCQPSSTLLSKHISEVAYLCELLGIKCHEAQ